MFTNTESISKIKHNVTYRMGPNIKLQTFYQIMMDFFITQGSVATLFKVRWYV